MGKRKDTFANHKRDPLLVLRIPHIKRRNVLPELRCDAGRLRQLTLWAISTINAGEVL